VKYCHAIDEFFGARAIGLTAHCFYIRQYETPANLPLGVEFDTSPADQGFPMAFLVITIRHAIDAGLRLPIHKRFAIVKPCWNNDGEIPFTEVPALPFRFLIEGRNWSKSSDSIRIGKVQIARVSNIRQDDAAMRINGQQLSRFHDEEFGCTATGLQFIDELGLNLPSGAILLKALFRPFDAHIRAGTGFCSDTICHTSHQERGDEQPQYHFSSQNRTFVVWTIAFG
jgi:hypothetical protein